MTSLERLFALEIEFYCKLRLAAGATDSSALHTSYALQMGYEPLLRQTAGAAVQQIDKIAQTLTLSGDPRDVLDARDSLVRLLGLKRFG